MNTQNSIVASLSSTLHLHPFGMQMPLRSYTSENYRFGFNGMENANDIASGNYTTDFRELDTRLGGRWWSTDPIVKPWESPYAGFSNNPIYFADPSGLNPEKGDKTDKKSRRNKKCDNCGFGSAETPIEIDEVEVIGQKDKPTPQPSAPSTPGNQNYSVPKKNWFQKEVEALEIGGDYAMNNSLIFQGLPRLIAFVNKSLPPSLQDDKKNGINWQMGDSNGAMSKYEAGSKLTPNEEDITILLSVINLVSAKALDFTTFTSAIAEPVLKVITDNDIKKMAEIQQNAAMKKVIEVKTDTVNFGTKGYISGSWDYRDTLYTTQGNDTIKREEILRKP